jgi:hypothetical protein
MDGENQVSFMKRVERRLSRKEKAYETEQLMKEKCVLRKD